MPAETINLERCRERAPAAYERLHKLIKHENRIGVVFDGSCFTYKSSPTAKPLRLKGIHKKLARFWPYDEEGNIIPIREKDSSSSMEIGARCQTQFATYLRTGAWPSEPYAAQALHAIERVAGLIVVAVELAIADLGSWTGSAVDMLCVNPVDNGIGVIEYKTGMDHGDKEYGLLRNVPREIAYSGFNKACMQAAFYEDVIRTVYKFPVEYCFVVVSRTSKSSGKRETMGVFVPDHIRSLRVAHLLYGQVPDAPPPPPKKGKKRAPEEAEVGKGKRGKRTATEDG